MVDDEHTGIIGVIKMDGSAAVGSFTFQKNRIHYKSSLGDIVPYDDR